MGEPTVSTNTYGSMDVSSIRIHSEPTLATHGTSKAYVDGKVADVKSDILGNAGPSWDTLKEIQTFLEGEPNVSAGLVNQIGGIQSQLDTEVVRAMGVEGALLSEFHAERDTRIMAVASVQTALSFETAERIQGQVDLNDRANYLENRANTLSQQHSDDDLRLSAEIVRATAAESSLQSQLATSVSEVNTRTDTELALKLDKTGGQVSGDLGVTGSISIGANWRLVSLGSSLEFRYSADGGSESPYQVAIPFFSV